MSKASLGGGTPSEYNAPYFMGVLSQIMNQLNGLSEGRMAQRYQTSAAIPTTGSYGVGDIVWKTTPVEAGGGGSKYVIIGWICTVAGTPGTLLEMRVLTGN